MKEGDLTEADLTAIFRELVENSPVGTYILREGKFAYVNRSLARMLGCEPDELVGKRGPLDFVHPEDRPRAAKMIRDRLEGRSPTVRYTVRGVRKDGGIIYADVFGQSLVHRGEVFLFGSVVDITERVSLLDSLRRGEEFLRSLIDAAPDAIVTVKPDGEIVDWSKGAERMFGWRAEDVLGRKFSFLLAPGARDEFARRCERARRANDFSEFRHLREIVCRHRDGSEFPAELSFSAWESLDGLRLVGVIRDITGRRESLWRWRKFVQELVRALSAVLQARDPYTSRHQLRVAELARAIARELEVGREVEEGVYVSALLHDVGKLAVPLEILAKPAELTSTERSLVEQHTWRGYEILRQVDFPWPVAEVALQHHERLDGSGYPQGLRDDEIILEARIVAVADVVEAMASHRPYRAALGLDAALEEIERGRGTLYDPQVVDACLRLFRDKGFRFKSQYDSRAPAAA